MRSRLLRKIAYLDRKLISDINKKLIDIAFYPEFEQKFPGSTGRSKADKALRGGLTQTEYELYKELNNLFAVYQDEPYDPNDPRLRSKPKSERKPNLYSVLYHRLYELERKLNSKPKATLRDVVDDPFYQNFAIPAKQQAVQKSVYQRSTQERSERMSQEEDKRQGYKLTITEATRDQLKAIQRYNPEWWPTVEEALRTKELVFIDDGEVVPVRNEKDLLDKLYKHNGKDDNPVIQALRAKFKAEEPTALWMKAHNDRGESAWQAFYELNNQQKGWLNKQPESVYHRKTFQISPIAIALIRHDSELLEWKRMEGIPKQQDLLDKLQLWLSWVKEVNSEIRAKNIPNVFVRYIDTSSKSGTWFNTTYKKFEAAIREHRVRSIAHLQEYIYNSMLASVGQAVSLDFGTKTYKYADDKSTTASSKYFYHSIINRLVA